MDGIATTGNDDKVEIVPPDCIGAVLLLKALEKVLRSQAMRTIIPNRARDEDDDSCRSIQGGRYEVFVKATSKTTTTFDVICEQIQKQAGTNLPPNSIKSELLSYARRQVSQCRHMKGKDMVFDNFSLVINYKRVASQYKHIDMRLPSYQFLLAVSDQMPATRTFRSRTNAHIANIDDLKRAWPSIPDDLVSFLREQIGTKEYLRELLEDFGDVLLPDLELQGDCVLETGTLVSLPGSVVHAGPPSDKFRAVLFFSGYPSNETEEAYDPDRQFSHVTLLSSLIDGVLPDIREARHLRFLLKWFVDILLQDGDDGQAQESSNLLAEGPLCDLVTRIVYTPREQRNVSEFIEKFIATQLHKSTAQPPTKKQKICLQECCRDGNTGLTEH